VVDYKIWSVIQQKVYKCQINNVNELCLRILKAWDELDQRVIDTAVGQWRTQCVKAKGAHFEHKLY